MPEPALDRPRVVPPIGEGVAAGVAQHVRMGLELQAGAGSALDHPGEAGCGERELRLLTNTNATSGSRCRFPAHDEQTIVLGSPSRFAAAVGGPEKGVLVGMLSDC
jgi:hypothetical protein